MSEDLFYETYLAARRAARRNEREDKTFDVWRMMNRGERRVTLIELARQAVDAHDAEQRQLDPRWGAWG